MEGKSLKIERRDKRGKSMKITIVKPIIFHSILYKVTLKLLAEKCRFLGFITRCLDAA